MNNNGENLSIRTMLRIIKEGVAPGRKILGRFAFIALFSTAAMICLVLLLLIGKPVSGDPVAGGIPSPPVSPASGDNRASPVDLSADFQQKPLSENGYYTFGSNDTFTGALRYLGSAPDLTKDLVGKIGGRCELNKISRGQRIKYELIEGQGLQKLFFPCGVTKVVSVQVNHGQADIKIDEIPHRNRERVYVCVVKKNYSLIWSAAQVGIAESQVMEVAHIFRSDIDFNNDIQAGDELKILVNELEDMEGNALAPGEVLATEIVLGNKQYWAIKYVGPEGRGFFDSKGQGLVKTFLRSPLPYLSISSGFAFQRFHPILGKVRPHLGVDFRAPTGTPVMAAASGRVIEAGKERGYGNVIKIHHGSLMTLYGHLSKIKVRKGQNVRQGQVIGATGATGLATGPHLHYGMYRNNVAIDPMSIKMTTSTMLYSKNFRITRDHAVTLLKNAQPDNKQ